MVFHLLKEAVQREGSAEQKSPRWRPFSDLQPALRQTPNWRTANSFPSPTEAQGAVLKLARAISTAAAKHDLALTRAMGVDSNPLA